jgi:hypothetical protein
MEREAATPRACARVFSIPQHRIYAAIKAGELVAHAIGRKSILLFSDVRDWIRAHPSTKSSKRTERKE